MEGKLVRLRRYEPSDLDELMRFVNDEEFAIETLGGEYLGGCGLHRIDWIDRNAEVGIVIWKKEYWGKGYGSDAMMVLLRCAFRKMNLHRVFLRVYEDN